MVYSRAIEEQKRQLRLSDEQREALIGLLLGDAHLETCNVGRTYRLKIEQSEAHRAYIDHLYNLFRPWVLTPPQPKQTLIAGRRYVKLWFQTVSHGSLRFYGQQFYHGGRKVVPAAIRRWLTPRGLAYWFMDDGSAKWRYSRAVLLNTQGFSQGEARRLGEALAQQFGLETYPRRQAEGYQIAISGHSLEQFRGLIGPYLLPEMHYKLPVSRRTELPKW